MTKACTSVPCPGFENVAIEIQPWIPTVDELRQAGASIMQPDGTYYSLRNGKVVHVSQTGEVIDE
jgi:4-hydroxyphenylpyruvate dioxygenase-like putative hemolysin